ncbi:MAG: YceI family protein [Thermodesulfobacteriota bacterium]
MQGFKKGFLFLFAGLLFLLAPLRAEAADYVIDSKNAHAYIQFKISHLGFSYVLGRFNHFDGVFSYDELNPAASRVKVTVDVSSVDTNNPERDKHLRSEKFFEVKKYPEATFVSSSYKVTGDKTALLKGKFTLHGVTRPITIKVTELGAGKDPWGGFRRGFEGSVTLALKDYNINTSLGPTAKEVVLFLSVEGIREK